MMGISQTGIAAIVDYSALNGTQAQLNALKALIPDVDSTSSSGSKAGGGFLDEMSPPAAVQLRVELEAIQALSAAGIYTVVEADNTANQINITTGIADFTLANSAVSIYRSGSEVLTARTLSKQTGGVLRIADATYVATAGDIVNWSVRL